MTTISSEAERLAAFLIAMQTHLGAWRDQLDEDDRKAWDDYDQAAALLLRIPELEAELEATKIGESFHDKQANEYARQVAHWIGKFDEVKAERDQLRAELKGRSDPMQNGTENDWRSEPWSFGEGLKTYKTTTQEGDK